MINLLLSGNYKVFDGAISELISIINKTRETINCYILTMDVRGNISFASNSNIQSYEIVPAIISLDIPAPIIEHTHFAIRYKDKTVGVGIIKQNLP